MEKKESVKTTILRRRAERDLLRHPGRIPSVTEDHEKLIHELQVQQIELEMQNEELQRAQEELGESKRRYLDLFDFAPSGYFTFDQKGRILEVNLTGSRMLGTSRSNLIRRRFTFYLDESSIPPFRQHLMEVFSDEIKASCELKVLPEYKKTPVYVLLESEVLGGGKERECRSVLMDITRQKRAEMEVDRQRQELAHVSRMATVKGLTGALVHELSQSLQSIQSNAQMTETILSAKRPDYREIQGSVKKTLKGVTEAREILNGFRELFRRGSIALTPLNINEIMLEIRDSLKENAVTKTPPVEVTTELARDLPLVPGDRTHLRVVLQNLGLNALDSMSHGGPGIQKLILRTEKENERSVKVSVKDTGTGITESDLLHLFEPGYTTKPEGMGMGLVISRYIIEVHGGTIGAVNNSGNGATFYFRIPIE